MGFGMETSSHKFGFFQETVVAYEIVTASGTVVRGNDGLIYYHVTNCSTMTLLISVTNSSTNFSTMTSLISLL